jgi:hypothetical protein
MAIIHNEPTAGQHITEVHCWIATYADGTEGIMAAGLAGIGMSTLMSSKRKLAEAMGAVARNLQQASLSTPNPISVRLVTFASTEGTRQ